MSIQYKNISSNTYTLMGIEFQPNSEYTIPTTELYSWSINNDVITKLINNEGKIGLNYVYYDTLGEQIAILTGQKINTKTLSEVITSWTQLKLFYNTTKNISLNYYDQGDYYFIWADYKLQKFFIPYMQKNTPEALEFEQYYKPFANIPESTPVRVTTCRIGRKLHVRYVSFMTSNPNSMDNTNIDNQSYNDITYKMYKWENEQRIETQNPQEAEETWLIFVPNYSYEIGGGGISIPNTLDEDINLWEVHCIANYSLEKALSIPHVPFISNSRIKFQCGQTIVIDSMSNPANMPYNAPEQNYPLTQGYPVPTNEICFIIKHPAGAQKEFQLFIQLFK